MPIRSIFALTTTLALALLSANAAAPATASRVSARTSPRAHGTPLRLVRHRSVGPAGSTVGPRADFNGDGFGDLTIGVPGEDLGSAGNAGGVNVLYGTASGLSSKGNQFWSQASSGVLGDAETNDGFGSATAVGDFNHDGFSDLAVGVPYEGIGSVANAGGVNILYGSASGLTAKGNQFWSQAHAGIHDKAEAGDEFGFALAARDFNEDGYSDLAVGVPREDGKHAVDEGAVNVIYGSADGLAPKGDEFKTGYGAGDRFGTALAAGNFDGKNGQDLAVGAPNAENDEVPGAGMVLWMNGASDGLGSPFSTMNYTEVPGEHCGASLASGNLNDDGGGMADVAVGCPDATYDLKNQGGVEVHVGSPDGLGQVFEPLVPPDAEAGDEFGTSVASADVGGDWIGAPGDELVVGGPLASDGSLVDAGRAWVVYIVDVGPLYQTIQQGEDGTKGIAETGDIFGEAVTTGNFDGDGFGDIAIGVPGERVGSVGGAGGVNVLYGSSSGIDGAGNQFWSQDTTGIVGAAEPEDFFGDALSGRTG